jgi:enoyl-CoA hydratase
MSAGQARAFSEMGHEVANRIESLSVPVIAAVNGFALGGGCEMALACDFIYATASARLGQPEVRLGAIPGFGGTQRLARRIGNARARELLFTADLIDAAEALRIGLVNRVFADTDTLMAEARAVALRIARQAPLAVAQAKRAVRRGADRPLEEASRMEIEMFAELFDTADLRRGMRAFLNKDRNKDRSNIGWERR